MTNDRVPTSHGLTGRVLVLEDLDQPRAWLCDLVRTLFPAVIAVDEAATLAQAREVVGSHQHDLALLDWELPDGQAESLIRHIYLNSPSTLIVVSTIHDDDERVFSALRAGAQGYVLKSQPRDMVASQLLGIERGEPPLSPVIAHKVLAYFRQKGGASGGLPTASVPAQKAAEEMADEVTLAPRELDVLRLVAKGYRNAEVAELLGLTTNTVGSYIKSIYRKLGVSSRAEAALEASRLGLAR
ncbi:response regulator transcription factor [Hydrogenophaga sp. 5NK40-0174]|uniref:response regulator transcription factor n=1 Tax=Hydrogenophaga sp. 5NK40-0174 TaxID=3127649 RepID=UPI00310227D5